MTSASHCFDSYTHHCHTYHHLLTITSCHHHLFTPSPFCRLVADDYSDSEPGEVLKYEYGADGGDDDGDDDDDDDDDGGGGGDDVEEEEESDRVIG